MSSHHILPDGVFPVELGPGALDAPHWEGTRLEQLRIQRCLDCREFQWGPELICHHCHSFSLEFSAVAPRGTIFSWERVWHPSKPELSGAVPFVILIIELEDAPGVRVIGNLVGDQHRAIEIGSPVEARFEHHEDYTLVQWDIAVDGSDQKLSQ